ncbi:hypothetical protein rsdtw13_18230 [Clostridium sp. TW13]|uniref:Uncharacterized protein n=1 Tax=Inconstantimicrobium mannanitabidum TaxID=1604901 RepID=A0ACB5RBQ1_9CLOT|nr:hypothetical protein rsdtw13_18230 [Clostridium sp. TW13]
MLAIFFSTFGKCNEEFEDGKFTVEYVNDSSYSEKCKDMRAAIG